MKKVYESHFRWTVPLSSDPLNATAICLLTVGCDSNGHTIDHGHHCHPRDHGHNGQGSHGHEYHHRGLRNRHPTVLNLSFCTPCVQPSSLAKAGSDTNHGHSSYFVVSVRNVLVYRVGKSLGLDKNSYTHIL